MITFQGWGRVNICICHENMQWNVTMTLKVNEAFVIYVAIYAIINIFAWHNNKAVFGNLHVLITQ